MQFNVPQFIDVEDKIFGPLTFKQFFLVIGGVLLLIFMWYFFELWFIITVGGPIILAIVASVFIKINDRPLFTIFMAWANYFIKPRVFIWRRK